MIDHRLALESDVISPVLRQAGAGQSAKHLALARDDKTTTVLTKQVAFIVMGSPIFV
jgi:hypothetical protein